MPITNDDDDDILLTVIADWYILMVFGLWLGYIMLISTFGNTAHTISPSYLVIGTKTSIISK